MTWSEDGERLASGSSDGSIRIWFMEKVASSLISSKATTSNSKITGNVSIEIINGTRNVNQLQFCPLDQNLLASASTDKSVKIWDISNCDSPKMLLSISTEIENLTLNWHPLKPILSVGTKDDRVLFYDLTGNDAKMFESLKFSSEVNDISWSSDGKDLALALGNGTVEIFREFQRIKILKAHTSDCFCVRFMGSDLLAVGSSDAQTSIWSRSQVDKEFTCFRVFNRMEWPVRTISFNYDSNFLAVGSEDPFIAIEHIKTGALVAKIPTGKASSESRAGIPINAVTWHPNKNILAFSGTEVDDRTGKATGSIKLFGL